jgi:hypothetical protein
LFIVLPIPSNSQGESVDEVVVAINVAVGCNRRISLSGHSCINCFDEGFDPGVDARCVGDRSHVTRVACVRPAIAEGFGEARAGTPRDGRAAVSDEQQRRNGDRLQRRGRRPARGCWKSSGTLATRRMIG